MTLTGTPIPPLTPGSQEWLKTISASKIPAILGISPWQSKYALWHLMAGNTEPWAGNKTTERGTFLESAVLDWFGAQHKAELGQLHYDSKLGYTRGDSFHHPDHSDWTAAPDGVFVKQGFREFHGVEIKTAQYSDGWGKPGTAEVPPYYLAQIAWQMVVCGFRRVYVPVLFGQPFEFREYVVNYEDVEADIPVIIAAVEEFQKSLADGIAPDIDGSTATYNTIKELHPEIDGETVEIPEDLGSAYLYAKETLDMATEAADKCKNEIAATMGTAKKATLWGQPLFTRQARGTGTPYLVAARTMPTITEAAA
jgi:putative phage-type endonuclease